MTAALTILLVLSIAAQTNNPSRKMAVTFDDLPYLAAGRQPYLSNARRVTDEIIRVLQSHRAPAVAFVNENKLQESGEADARIALLKQWVDAGMILGNHTYSHPDFNTLTVEQFQNEIIKGEVVTRRLMQSRQPYQLFFRHPMTHTGDTQAKKEAIENFLAARGYRFITLEEAMADPAYQTKDTLVSRSGPTWLWRWMKSKGMNVSFKDDPEPPQWVMDLYR